MSSPPDVLSSTSTAQSSGCPARGGAEQAAWLTPRRFDAWLARQGYSVFAMIEDRRGVAAVESIARVPGIAGLDIGPVDLGLGLGLGMDREKAPFADALRRIVGAGHAADATVTMHAVRPEEADRWHDFGFDELVLTSDIELLRAALDGGVARVRNGDEAAGTNAGPYGSRETS